MRSRRLVLAICVPLVLTLPSLCQEQTVARLTRESHADIVRPDLTHGEQAPHATVLHDSALSRAAADALFVNSDLLRARQLAERALRRDRQDVEALFVRMELAELRADYATALETAVRLCEAGGNAAADPRVRLAAVRVREAAANTPEFRAIIPRVQSILANTQQPWPELQLALLNAAMDGAPGLDPYALARGTGILTDWRIVGPIGIHPGVDLDQPSISPADDLSQNFYAGRAVENFQFADGWIRLPDYLARHGSYYAAGRFASLGAGIWQLSVESAGRLQVFVDGQQVGRTAAQHKRDTVAFEVVPGPHRVLVKFAASAAPLRVMLINRAPLERVPLRSKLSAQEATYLLAAEHYAESEFGASIRQVDALDSAGGSVALQSLRAQALDRSVPQSHDVAQSWEMRSTSTVPGVALGGEENWWARRIAEHPSCEILQAALAFYDARGLSEERDATQQKLDGCAPESLAYAESLAHDGRHADAARALRRLLAGAPLNREARLMLIRELQLAGDDEAAERAAAEWLRIAPNAPSYHRLAASANLGDEHSSDSAAQFYLPYRRDAAPLAREATNESSGAASLLLLDDQVALARADGSVSLYVHTARRFFSPATDPRALAGSPRGVQVLTLRILHPDGTATPMNEARPNSEASLAPGDAIDAEYVVNFTGDSGIPEHAEAFQFVFGSFNEPVLHARFVVLTAADHGDGGVVIATGEPPAMTAKVRDGMLERVWEKNEAVRALPTDTGMAVVRVVEQENGWSQPSSAEHQKRIETIHPGPRPEDS